MTIENDAYVMGYAINALVTIEELYDEVHEWMEKNPCWVDESGHLYAALKDLGVAKNGIKLFINEFDNLCGHTLDEWINIVEEVKNRG